MISNVHLWIIIFLLFYQCTTVYCKIHLMSLIRLRNIHVSFGGPAILESISVAIEAGERLCLLGRNGTGKSTLLKVISGEVKADSGDLEFKQNLKIAVLDQEPRGDLRGSIFDVVAMGLGENAKLLQD